MELELTFRNFLIRGEGRDWVGKFAINGRYQTGDGRCWLRKRYLGKHEVLYEGYNEGKGIWGVWTIPPMWRGGFHIWPLAMDDPSMCSVSEELEEPILEEAEALQPIGAVALGAALANWVLAARACPRLASK